MTPGDSTPLFFFSSEQFKKNIWNSNNRFSAVRFFQYWLRTEDKILFEFNLNPQCYFSYQSSPTFHPPVITFSNHSIWVTCTQFLPSDRPELNYSSAMESDERTPLQDSFGPAYVTPRGQGTRFQQTQLRRFQCCICGLFGWVFSRETPELDSNKSLPPLLQCHPGRCNNCDHFVCGGYATRAANQWNDSHEQLNDGHYEFNRLRSSLSLGSSAPLSESVVAVRR